MTFNASKLAKLFSVMVLGAMVFLPATKSLAAAPNALSGTSLISDANLKSYWPLDNSSIDYFGVNNGSDINMSYATGQFNQAGNFNGSNGKINIGNTGFPSGTTDLTISAWIKSSSNADQPIFTFGSQVAPGDSIEFKLDSNGKLLLQAWYSSGTEAANIINDGNWHYVVLTVSGNTTIKYYVDGNLDTTGTFSAGRNTVLSGTANIGYGWDGYFSGDIDDVAIFNRVLSATEISNYYTGVLNTGGGTATTTDFSAFGLWGSIATTTEALMVQSGLPFWEIMLGLCLAFFALFFIAIGLSKSFKALLKSKF